MYKRQVYDLLNSIPMDELADLMIVSQVELVKGEGGAASAVEGLGVAAAHATGEKCERCWKYSSSIGSHAAHPTPVSYTHLDVYKRQVWISQSARYFTAALTCVWTKCWKRAL